jgi:hypothetical protein
MATRTGCGPEKSGSGHSHQNRDAVAEDCRGHRGSRSLQPWPPPRLVVRIVWHSDVRAVGNLVDLTLRGTVAQDGPWIDVVLLEIGRSDSPHRAHSEAGLVVSAVLPPIHLNHAQSVARVNTL